MTSICFSKKNEMITEIFLYKWMSAFVLLNLQTFKKYFFIKANNIHVRNLWCCAFVLLLFCIFVLDYVFICIVSKLAFSDSIKYQKQKELFCELPSQHKSWPQAKYSSETNILLQFNLIFVFTKFNEKSKHSD